MTVEHRRRDAIDPGSAELYPPRSARVDPAHDVVPTGVAPEECVGVQAGRRVATGVLDQLDFGIRGEDALRVATPGSQRGNEAHRRDATYVTVRPCAPSWSGPAFRSQRGRCGAPTAPWW